jgi:hypothetical protein
MLGMELGNGLTFSAGGKGKVAIPLTSYRWPGTEERKPVKHLCSFVGNAHTHPIREQMFRELQGKEGFYLEQIPHHLPHYPDIMNSSVFALCPRGYGKTSFRLYEALAMGTIPIYISDEYWLPYEEEVVWNQFCIIVRPDEIKDIPKLISDFSCEEIKNTSNICKRIWNEYFSYDATVKQIVRILEEE